MAARVSEFDNYILRRLRERPATQKALLRFSHWESRMRAFEALERLIAAGVVVVVNRRRGRGNFALRESLP